MSVNIRGMDEVLAKMESKLGSRAVAKYSNEALNIAGRYMAANLKSAVGSYRDTGATVNEVTVGKARLKGGVRTIKVGWDGGGSKQRYRLVHLNEFGYTRFGRTYGPRGMGKVQNAYDSSREPMKALEKHELEKLL
ncbi:gp9 protein [Paucilactobacillus hokkaidonensis JCM 18461]|uniref:Gp9 protein n=2 Tax=Paucilactobacillus hokkaidonensis TaxID=1193095 RepID=A0A0A1GTA7_9LACO|nr:hypothetical protein [Paucilactobacillus hokkaidonensis]BAP85527.1 gp9 protein [Paucilactobacillus hokkaidonensis JCM 18461]